jgi:excisionase family DNA binding protein
MSEGLLTVREAARHLKVSRSTLERLRAEGKGPRFIRVSERSIRYSLADIEEWVKHGGFNGTTDDTDSA